MTRLSILLAAGIALSALAQPNISISGRVIDAAGKPQASLGISAIDPLNISNGHPATTSADGTFVFDLPPAIYALVTFAKPPLVPAVARVDARNGSVSNLEMRIDTHSPIVPDDPPRAALIQFTVPDDEGRTTISGSAGAVPGRSGVVLVTMDTGQVAWTQSSGDGSFSAAIFAPAGSTVLVKDDPIGFQSRNVRDGAVGGNLALMAGTYVRVPLNTNSNDLFAVAGDIGLPQNSVSGPPWTLEGTMTSGTTLRVDGTLRVFSSAVQQASSIRSKVYLQVGKCSGANGAASLAANRYLSTLMTPTDLPIERESNSGTALQTFVDIDLNKAAADRAEGAIHFALTLPTDLPAGIYLPEVIVSVEGLPTDSSDLRIGPSTRRNYNTAYLPAIKVGNPALPRLPVMLMADVLSNGTRGARAEEDRGSFALSSRLRMNDSLEVRRLDASGAPISYRLEPFVPTVSLADWGRGDLPLIPFRFPSGHLSVTIAAPDGSTRVIGPAPFVQTRMKSNGDSGENFSNPFGGFSRATTEIFECEQLSTLDPRFEIEFPRDGRYVVTLDASIDDIWGSTWNVGGTFEVHVGRLLSVDTSLIPGTPLEVGDRLSPAVILRPPVAADVQVRVRIAPQSDSARMIERVISGRANRFGYFNPPLSDVVLTDPGEYRVDVLASSDEWSGGRTWGGVIAPRDTPIIAHGRRGMVNTQVLGSQWFFRSQTPFPNLPDVSHPNPPFNSGDVFWMQKSDTQFALFTFQDPRSLVTDLLRKRLRDSGVGTRDPGTFDERVPLGEIPLFSTRADGVEPHIDPSRVDLWGYSYRFIERPSIAVRELIAEDSVQLVYWPFHDQYGAQIGQGANGDLPNDFKFEFGGVTLHGSALAQPLYAGYASLFVLVPDDDKRGGTRVFPPFQGNGGGPSGGPLFTLKGKDVDLFFHPTAVRPGTILQLGERASFSGYSAPPLPSRIEITITSPSGQLRTINGRANSFGWFEDPTDAGVYETGVWKAKVAITFDGRTSAGQVSAPFPSGDVLGSRSGEFYFYVVSPDSPPLAVAPDAGRLHPAEGPLKFVITPPAGLRNPQLTYTATMPGFLLEEGSSSTLLYTYDAPALAKDFPNLDLQSDDGYSGVDPITISLCVTGVDGNGKSRSFARELLLQGEELLAPPQIGTPIPLRRRAAH